VRQYLRPDDDRFLPDTIQIIIHYFSVMRHDNVVNSNVNAYRPTFPATSFVEMAPVVSSMEVFTDTTDLPIKCSFDLSQAKNASKQ
jgi:hypothetical protein